MSHVFHNDLPGHSPRQLLHDGCPECEQRGRDAPTALGALDDLTFVRAWTRAGQMTTEGLPDCSSAERPLLEALGAVQVRLEHAVGLPIGTLPQRPAPMALRAVDGRGAR